MLVVFRVENMLVVFRVENMLGLLSVGVLFSVVLSSLLLFTDILYIGDAGLVLLVDFMI